MAFKIPFLDNLSKLFARHQPIPCLKKIPLIIAEIKSRQRCQIIIATDYDRMIGNCKLNFPDIKQSSN